MPQSLQTEHRHLLHKLGISWVIFTIVIFCMVVFYRWEHIQLQTIRLTQSHANQLAFKIEGLIDKIVESGHTLPFFKGELTHCSHELLDELRSIEFNHPDVSAIVISDAQNKLLCASSDMIKTLPLPKKTRLSLFGPLKLDHSESDVFLLQQKMGSFHIGMYFIRPLIENYLQKNSSGFDFTGLYDNHDKKMLVYAGTPGNMKSTLQKAETHDESLMFIPLHSLDNISLVVKTRPYGFRGKHLLMFILTTLPFLLVSWFFYKYVARIIGNRYSLQSALTNALRMGHFYPAYQAIRDESQNCYCGAEVLIRWHTDMGDVIMPDYFIDEAERSGLIVPITLQLIEKSFRECHKLLEQMPLVYLSFNLSPHHFKDPDFFRRFYELCSDYCIDAKQVMLELTERELFDRKDKAVIRRMKELGKRGFKLAIDDFGTGHANLHYLQHFPFTYLKIDKLFISSIGTGAITEHLNRSIINMANSLKLNIIAEGVETEAQRDYLLLHQVHFIQGWLYTPALPYSDFDQLLRSN